MNAWYELESRKEKTMKITRRGCLAAATKMAGAICVIVAFPTEARACLYGTWHVQCPAGHINQVDQGTCQHKCEQCGRQVFDGNVVTVVCKNGHPNRITTGAGDKQNVTQHYICPTCKTDCRLD